MLEREDTAGAVISIHAPARGATGFIFLSAINRTISIHAPARGATRSRTEQKQNREYFNPRSREGSDFTFFKRSLIQSHFNPRSREGSDFFRFRQPVKPFCISIHAPARGATRINDLAFYEHQPFQSTLPRGERRSPIDHPGGDIYFNPRSREGSDQIVICEDRLRKISIHAPARGATKDGTVKGDQVTDFNPRSREGSDRVCFDHQ